LDEAFIRTGRFDYKIPFLYPGRDARRLILQIHLGLLGGKPKPKMDESAIVAAIESVTDKTDGFSGSELEELTIRAKRHALSDSRDYLIGEDVEQAVSTIRIDQVDRGKTREKHLNLAQKYTDDAVFLSELACER
jgi:proteasome regulatory subunit